MAALGVKQTKKESGLALVALAEACGPTWVLSIVREAAATHKAPKVLCEALLSARFDLAEGFGVPPLAPTEAIAFALDHAEHRVSKLVSRAWRDADDW